MKAVIFDLDGVLVDACEIHYLALNEALKAVVGYPISRKDHESKFNGRPTTIKLDMLGIQGEQRQKVQELKQKATIDQIKQHIFSQVPKKDMMKYLTGKGMWIGCYTNAKRESAELMLMRAGLLDYIDALICNEDVSEPKPSPMGYNMLIKEANCPLDQIVIVEDSEIGLQAAEATGAKVIKVKGPSEVNMALFKGRL